MRLRTEIEKQTSCRPISCRDGIFVLGSCFAENIGLWLKENCLNVCLNPFGVLYNPASIASSLLYLLNNRRFVADDAVQGPDGMFYSFAHHGQFAATSAAELVSLLNCNLETARRQLFEARHLLITFGTAWVFERNGAIVANCHKFPSKEFERRRLSADEIVAEWKPLVERLIGEEAADGFPRDKHIVFSVSPIRHLKDGLHGNQLSKATLLLAIDQLCRLFPANVEYLPIYELLVDDLRDYRFYADDLVHPSTLAIDFVKDYFSACCLDAECRSFLRDVNPLIKSLRHRPLHPESPAHQIFAEETERKLNEVREKFGVFA